MHPDAAQERQVLRDVSNHAGAGREVYSNYYKQHLHVAKGHEGHRRAGVRKGLESSAQDRSEVHLSILEVTGESKDPDAEDEPFRLGTSFLDRPWRPPLSSTDTSVDEALGEAAAEPPLNPREEAPPAATSQFNGYPEYPETIDGLGRRGSRSDPAAPPGGHDSPGAGLGATVVQLRTRHIPVRKNAAAAEPARSSPGQGSPTPPRGRPAEAAVGAPAPGASPGTPSMPVCAACNERILGKFYEKDGLTVHVECFKLFLKMCKEQKRAKKAASGTAPRRAPPPCPAPAASGGPRGGVHQDASCRSPAAVDGERGRSHAKSDVLEKCMPRDSDGSGSWLAHAGSIEPYQRFSCAVAPPRGSVSPARAEPQAALYHSLTVSPEAESDLRRSSLPPAPQDPPCPAPLDFDPVPHPHPAPPTLDASSVNIGHLSPIHAPLGAPAGAERAPEMDALPCPFYTAKPRNTVSLEPAERAAVREYLEARPSAIAARTPDRQPTTRSVSPPSKALSTKLESPATPASVASPESAKHVRAQLCDDDTVPDILLASHEASAHASRPGATAPSPAASEESAEGCPGVGRGSSVWTKVGEAHGEELEISIVSGGVVSDSPPRSPAAEKKTAASSLLTHLMTPGRRSGSSAPSHAGRGSSGDARGRSRSGPVLRSLSRAEHEQVKASRAVSLASSVGPSARASASRSPSAHTASPPHAATERLPVRGSSTPRGKSPKQVLRDIVAGTAAGDAPKAARHDVPAAPEANAPPTLASSRAKLAALQERRNQRRERAASLGAAAPPPPRPSVEDAEATAVQLAALKAALAKAQGEAQRLACLQMESEARRAITEACFVTPPAWAAETNRVLKELVAAKVELATVKTAAHDAPLTATALPRPRAAHPHVPFAHSRRASASGTHDGYSEPAMSLAVPSNPPTCVYTPSRSDARSASGGGLVFMPSPSGARAPVVQGSVKGRAGRERVLSS
eukprot:TRINITY_DN12242_c0_g3_i1.p1 TRINITY_DN12242_c0_g3~~TRINITY_DN12242_c0_g3_i1.p1  ORF type:complete len:996 (+),score=314.21 TRINITY_DN12242_c0_g3_i1:80-2989(+)